MNIQELTQHMQICDTVNRYFAAIDDKQLNLAVLQATFAADGCIVRPDGSILSGWDEILEGQQKSFARFRTCQHVITNYYVDITGNTATARANVTAMHVWNTEVLDPCALETYFQAGGVLRITARHEAEGWRITELGNNVVWRTGSGFGMMVNFGKG